MRAHCIVEITEIYSHTFLAKISWNQHMKLLCKELISRNFFLVRENFSFFYTLTWSFLWLGLSQAGYLTHAHFVTCMQINDSRFSIKIIHSKLTEFFLLSWIFWIPTYKIPVDISIFNHPFTCTATQTIFYHQRHKFVSSAKKEEINISNWN